MRAASVFIIATVPVLALLFLIPTASSFDSPTKQKCIDKMSKNVSSWLARSQYEDFLLKIETDLADGKSAAEIANSTGSYLTGTLTGAQWTTLGTKAAALSAAGLSVMDLIDVLSDTLHNNLQPFLGQMVAAVDQGKAAGTPEDEINERCYQMTDQFVTFKRLNTITMRYKARFTPAQWKPIYNNFKGLFKFGLYPDLAP